MSPYASEAPFALSLRGARICCPASLQGLESQGARSAVLVRDPLQRLDALGVSAFANEELGGFFEADDGDTCNGHDEDEGTRGVPDVTPALIIGLGAGLGVGEDRGVEAGVIGEEGPCEEACDELSNSCGLESV